MSAKVREELVLSHAVVTAEVETPFDHVDIAQRLKTLPTHEYQRCAPPDHKTAGYSVDDDGTPMSINVEMIGTGLVVQQYRFGRGVDAILDVVGSDYLARNVECLSPDGHLVIIGGSMAPTQLNLGLLMSKRASVTATMLRSRPPEQKAAIVAGVTRDVLPPFDAGAIRVVVDTVIPLRDAAQAHELLESKHTIGKLILDNRDAHGRPAR
jgi:threonine dehydrogenase-like Zn-dependent dehydrogenase